MPYSSKSANPREDDRDFRKGLWTSEEDTLLFHYIAQHGEGRWNLLSKRAGLRRTGKSCRLRWLNYLKPDVKHGNLTLEEQLLILDLHSKWGNRWSKIAQHLPGRTDNEIKNYWRTRVQKQARQLKIDANSTKFQDMIRCFGMPRLLQKIQESTLPPDMLSGNQTIYQLIINYTSSTSQPPLDEVPCQGPAAVQAFKKDYVQLSDSEQYTSSCISPDESLMSVYPPSTFHVFSNSSDYSTFTKELQTNPVDMSSPPGLENPTRDHQMAESHRLGYDLEETMWNINELWQLKNSQEISQN